MTSLTLKINDYGVLSDGTKVKLYTVSNGTISFSATDYGCTLTSIILPNKGKTPVSVSRKPYVDALMGFSSLDGYLNNGSCFGTIVGRYANRIGGASFELDGKKYQLDNNDGGNTLHGGFDRWEKMMWNSREVKTEHGLGVEFYRTSIDGEQGFPGNLQVSVIYTLNEDNAITLEYKATTDAPTPICLTNHAYFNLKGDNGGSVFDQVVQIDASKVLEVGSNLIPTGKLLDVKGTCFDFTSPKTIGQDVGQTEHGYDHCWCIDGYDSEKKPLVKFCEVTDPESGRKMIVKTTQPGVQLYTGNFVTGVIGKQGFPYQDHGAMCLETQAFPDSPNKPNFPSSVLKPGEEYHHITQYIFEV